MNIPHLSICVYHLNENPYRHFDWWSQKNVIILVPYLVFQ